MTNLKKLRLWLTVIWKLLLIAGDSVSIWLTKMQLDLMYLLFPNILREQHKQDMRQREKTKIKWEASQLALWKALRGALK